MKFTNNETQCKYIVLVLKIWNNFTKNENDNIIIAGYNI